MTAPTWFGRALACGGDILLRFADCQGTHLFAERSATCARR
jgi:hypothetical protein